MKVDIKFEIKNKETTQQLKKYIEAISNHFSFDGLTIRHHQLAGRKGQKVGMYSIDVNFLKFGEHIITFVFHYDEVGFYIHNVLDVDGKEMFKVSDFREINRDELYKKIKLKPDSEDEFYNLISDKNISLKSIDTTKIKRMNHLFREIKKAGKINQIKDIEDWNTSNVEMFIQAFSDYDGPVLDLSKWDVSNVWDFSSMFYRAKTQPKGLENWDVSSGNDFNWMFKETDFNIDISGWNMRRVRDLNSMFQDNKKFNQDISKWNLGGRKINVCQMFWNTTSFNQDISKWNFEDPLYKNYDYMFKGTKLKDEFKPKPVGFINFLKGLLSK